MKNYKITIAYDGTRYKGWQLLGDNEATIQGKLTNVLSSIAGHEVEIIGSGRTDAGVHAKGQVANFHIEDSFTGKELLLRMNAFLPEDIAILDIAEVAERFHARYQATEKTYRYRIHTSKIPNVFERKYVYTYTDRTLDIGCMQQAADLLLGTHDFASFCGNKKMKKSTVRTISQIKIEALGNEIQIDYTGNGFLQNMVRILTGTLIEIGDGRRAPEDIVRILESKDRKEAGYTVPAQGLVLMKVSYGKMDGIQ